MTRNTATILGVAINSTSASSLLREILDFMADSSLEKKLVIFTPNPEFLVAAQKNAAFKDILNQADINIPDGYGLVCLSRLTGQEIEERVSGADLVEKLLEAGDEKGWTVGVAGARGGDLEESEILVKNLQSRYPGLKIYSLDNLKFKTCLPTGKISNLKFNMVLACQGMKKQEEWIIANKDKIDSRVFMGVGGSLDFLTGFTKRAPGWMRVIGLEWLWRGLQKPGHWKRIFNAVVVFPLLVVREKLIGLIRQI